MLPRCYQLEFSWPIIPTHLVLLYQQTVFILAHGLGVPQRPGLCLPNTLLDTGWDQSHSIHFPKMQLSFVTRWILGKDLCSWFCVCVCFLSFYY